MTATVSKSPRRNATLDQLNGSFAVIRDCQPLALGIHKEILVRLPELDPAQLRSAMRIHTASTRYLKGLLATSSRFDLDGKAAGEVTAEQREVASETLKERFKTAAKRRKLEEKVQSDALREQQAQQERQEKLAQLAARFNSR